MADFDCYHLCMAFVIYGIHAGDGEYRYVGQTVSFRPRVNKHRRDARKGSAQYVHRWMASVGVDNCVFDVLEEVESRDLLDAAEMRWIAELRSRGFNLTNLSDGGNGPNGISRAGTRAARLTTLQAVAIVEALESTDRTYLSISEEFGVSPGTIYAIAIGTSWKNVPRSRPLRGTTVCSDDCALNVISLLAEGRSAKDVAATTGLLLSTVRGISSGASKKHLPRPPGFDEIRESLRSGAGRKAGNRG